MTRRKYKPYPEYKDSGVEWLGRVPRHWKNLRLRHVAPFRNSNVDKKSYDGQRKVRLCNYTDVYYNEFIANGLNFMEATASESEIERFSLRKGHVVFTKDSEDPLDIGIPALVLEDFDSVICGYHLALISPDSQDLGRFIFRYFQSHPAKAHFFVESPGITRYGLSQDAISDVPIPVPPDGELPHIADYIDRETSRIDRLIEKKERFIELLKEKRQALITHAVTKGLPPEAAAKAGLDTNPPMKDSGIEWIGEVPAHWEVYPLKRELSFITSGSRGWAEFYSDDGSVFLRIGNLSRGTFDLDLSDIQRVSPPEGSEGSRTKVEKNDVLFSITAYLGSVAVVPEDLEEAYVSQHIALTRLNGNRLFPVWLGYFTLSDCGQIWLQSMSYGGTKVQLSLDDIKDMPVAVAPIFEQITIAQTLQKESEKTDKLISKTLHSISLLRERRTALITAAVTGQIDVREAVASKAAIETTGEAPA